MTSSYLGPVELFDGRSTTLKRKQGVLIEDGRIAWAGAHARAPRAARQAEALEEDAGFLTPGLFDCHVHLCMDGEPDFLAEARESEPYAALKAVRNAERHLRSGTTTVRDLGGIGFVTSDVARAIDGEVVAGPRVIPSGKAITITGGHGWSSFAQQADGPQGLRQAVRQQMRAGARSIPVIATGGRLSPRASLDFASLSPEELEAAVEEAHSWGVPIAAHAHGDAGARRAVQAGIDSVEHGSLISAQTVRMMKERGTFHVATISAHAEIVGHSDEVADYVMDKGRQIMEAARASFERALRAGVRHAVGTDAGTPFNAHGHGPLEMVRMADWGMPPPKVLVAATSNAAALCRVEDETGTVEVGKAADLVLYEANPLDDVRAVLRPAVVFRGGERFSGRPVG